jgi:DNA-binding beta-propeller fold protein YncE
MNEIYVIDGRAQIIIYTNEMFPLYTLSKKDRVVAPQGLAVDEEGNLYVTQAPTKENPLKRLSIYNACLTWERDIYFEGFEGEETFNPYRVAIDKRGLIYVSGSSFQGVLVLDRDGNILEILSPEENGKKSYINSVSIDETGQIYLVSEEMGRVYVYNEERKLLLQFGEKGGSSGKLSRPKGVGVDIQNRRMYVADYMRHTILVYDNEGNFMFEFGGKGWGEGWFQYPIDISVDTASRVLVVDFFNRRVQIFNPRLISKKTKEKTLARSRSPRVTSRSGFGPINVQLPERLTKRRYELRSRTRELSNQ